MPLRCFGTPGYSLPSSRAGGSRSRRAGSRGAWVICTATVTSLRRSTGPPASWPGSCLAASRPPPSATRRPPGRTRVSRSRLRLKIEAPGRSLTTVPRKHLSTKRWSGASASRARWSLTSLEQPCDDAELATYLQLHPYYRWCVLTEGAETSPSSARTVRHPAGLSAPRGRSVRGRCGG